MRHGKSGKKLGRTSSHRKAMLRNMVTSLFKYEKIETTDSKAKELRKVADKMVTLGKRGDLHARRQALSYVRDGEVVGKLFSDISERFRERKGGYTRIVKTGFRVGDNAPMSIIELTAEVKKAKAKAKGKKKAAAAA
jgi:large subunit ribosomal protein L17